MQTEHGTLQQAVEPSGDAPSCEEKAMEPPCEAKSISLEETAIKPNTLASNSISVELQPMKAISIDKPDLSPDDLSNEKYNLESGRAERFRAELRGEAYQIYLKLVNRLKTEVKEPCLPIKCIPPPEIVQQSFPATSTIYTNVLSLWGRIMSTSFSYFLYIILVSSTIRSQRTEMGIPFSFGFGVCDLLFCLLPVINPLFLLRSSMEFASREVVYYWLLRQGIVIDFENRQNFKFTLCGTPSKLVLFVMSHSFALGFACYQCYTIGTGLSSVSIWEQISNFVLAILLYVNTFRGFTLYIHAVEDRLIGFNKFAEHIQNQGAKDLNECSARNFLSNCFVVKEREIAFVFTNLELDYLRQLYQLPAEEQAEILKFRVLIGRNATKDLLQTLLPSFLTCCASFKERPEINTPQFCKKFSHRNDVPFHSRQFVFVCENLFRDEPSSQRAESLDRVTNLSVPYASDFLGLSVFFPENIDSLSNNTLENAGTDNSNDPNNENRRILVQQGKQILGFFNMLLVYTTFAVIGIIGLAVYGLVGTWSWNSNTKCNEKEFLSYFSRIELDHPYCDILKEDQFCRGATFTCGQVGGTCKIPDGNCYLKYVDFYKAFFLSSCLPHEIEFLLYQSSELSDYSPFEQDQKIAESCNYLMGLHKVNLDRQEFCASLSDSSNDRSIALPSDCGDPVTEDPPRPCFKATKDNKGLEAWDLPESECLDLCSDEFLLKCRASGDALANCSQTGTACICSEGYYVKTQCGTSSSYSSYSYSYSSSSSSSSSSCFDTCEIERNADSCAELGKYLLELTIFTDSYPSETGLHIQALNATTQDVTVVDWIAPGSFYNPSSYYNRNYCITPSLNYTIYLLDLYGDGISPGGYLEASVAGSLQSGLIRPDQTQVEVFMHDLSDVNSQTSFLQTAETTYGAGFMYSIPVYQFTYIV